MVLLLLFSEAYKANRLNLLHTETNCENQMQSNEDKLRQ